MDKERKIAFYTLVKDMWANNADGLEGLIPFYEIKEVFNYIDGRKRRSLKLKSNKACSLESFSMKQDSKDSSILITGLFKSAAYKYRPPYWDTETDEERESPKKQTEGEKEKTHFAIKITNDEVFLLVEVNGNGVSVNNIISYLNQFTREYLKKKKKTKNFTVEYTKIARDNFISELEKLKRATSIDVFFNKSLLGSRALQFSERTSAIQDQVKLTLKAERNKSAKEVGIDIFNRLNRQKKNNAQEVSKIRIYGKNENDKDTFIDTTFMEKIEPIKVSINESTGQVQTMEIYRFLKSLILPLLIMEYILLFIDFLRTREKRIFLVNVIIPLIVSIIVFLYSDSCRFYSVVDAIQSDILSVIGILLGFTISVFAIFLTSEGANIEKARNSYIEKVKLGSEPVSLYRAITINFTYIVVVEGFLLLIGMIYPIFFSTTFLVGKILFSFNVFLLIHCILMTLRLILDFYFVITKK